MRRARRVQHQRLGVADIGEMRKELERLDEPGARGAAAFDAEADHRPRSFRDVFPRERMVGMVRQGPRHAPGHGVRSDARSYGHEGVSTWKSRWAPVHKT